MHSGRSRFRYEEERKALPIYTYKEDLIEALQQYQCLVIVGDTGSGKTTQLPQYVLESIPSIRSIAVTQPRRIAAISAARRVSDEMGTRLGKEVGYSIRFERVASSETKLLYMTDGTLLRSCVSDPKIEDYDMVILDEAHERSLETDILFGLLRRACRLRPELKLVVMSATLDIDKFSEFFGDCPVFSIPGRMYAVDILWQKKMKFATLKATYVQRAVETAMHIHQNEEPGDILVFLTGQQEIEQAMRKLTELHEDLDYHEVRFRNHVRDMVVFPIYSALETLEQRAIFEPAWEGVRKIVFSTNIAQTSVTVPGIRYVVDSGFVKQKMYDAQTGMDALVVVPISQAAAIQRAGRAGRTATGKVYRLYSREAFEDMEPATIPEIQRSSLIGTVLNLKTMGIDDILNFEFIDPPDPTLVVAAIRQLFLLGAVDESGHLTPLGTQMSQFPISPFLSRAIISSCLDFPCSSELLTIAAMLSVEEIFTSPRSEKKKQQAEEARRQFDSEYGDHFVLLNAYESWERDGGWEKEWCFDNFVHFRAVKSARSVRQQLALLVDKLGLPIVSCRGADHGRERKRRKVGRDFGRGESSDGGEHLDPIPILKSLCTAFYVNTAKRHTHRPFYFHYITSAGLTSSRTTHSSSEGANEAANQVAWGPGMVALHVDPKSTLAQKTKPPEWVIYNDVQYVNRANMRCVSKIDFGMVEVLMGRVKLVDERKLCGGVEERNRRGSVVSLADVVEMETVDTVGVVNDEAGKSFVKEEGSEGKGLEFELVHEVIDEQRHVERALGEEIGGTGVRGTAVTKVEGVITVNGSPPKSPMGRHGHAPGADEEDEEAGIRKDKAALAREKYLSRKKRR